MGFVNRQGSGSEKIPRTDACVGGHDRLESYGETIHNMEQVNGGNFQLITRQLSIAAPATCLAVMT